MSDFEKLGPYRIEDKLGQGGMGAVYRGVHERTGEKVAIKVIVAAVENNPRFQKRFEAEIETLTKLNHPNIVKISGKGIEEGHAFFSMQMVEGPSLQQKLKKEKRLAWDQVIQYGIDICGALKHAHDLGIVHRDLKPANLLINENNELLLSDFGIVKQWWGDDMTAAGAMLGTADYMAPEQADDRPVTPRTDLYALGSVLYALLVGRPPFGGKQLTQVITSLRTDPPPPIDLILPDLPSELALLVHELLQKEPEDRPPTALSVGKRLRAMKAGLSRRAATQIDDANQTVVNRKPKSFAREESLEVNDGAPIPTDEQMTLDATLDSAAATDLPGLETSESEVREFREFTTPEPQTHFKTIDQEDRLKATASPDTQSVESSTSWENLLSIGGMILLLCGMFAGVVYMIQDPSADTLYGRIRSSQDGGDLAKASGDIEQFLRNFPDDPRREEVNALADQLDSERIYRRLRARARLRGGVDRLAPAEQAFVDAMVLRDQNVSRAKSLLQAWLTVFGNHVDKDTQKMVSVVRNEIKVLSMPESKADDQIKKLRNWVNTSLASMSDADRVAFLKAVIVLYESKPWAQDEITRARDMLNRLEAP